MVFISWLLYSFKCLSQKTLIFQKDFDLINQIYGKSKTNQNIDYLRGLSSSKTTSWRYLNRVYKEDSQKIDLLFNDPRSIIWIDNYSKFYKLSLPMYL